jgi:hypothetical protein
MQFNNAIRQAIVDAFEAMGSHLMESYRQRSTETFSPSSASGQPNI